MAVPIAAVCKTALGVHGNSCTLQGCSVVSYVSLAAPHSNSTSTKLCAISAKKCKAVKTERRGQCGSLNELPVYRRATAFNVTLFLPHIPFVFLFEILLLLDFFSLALSNPLPFHCVSIYLTHFLHSSLTFSSSFLFQNQFSLAFRNIYSLFQLPHLFCSYLFSCSLLPSLFLFLCLPVLCSLLHCSLPPPLSHIPSPLFLISSCRCCSCRNLRHSQGGVKALHVSLPPCKRGGGCSICRSWDNGSCQQDVGVLFKCGNVP